MSNDLVNWLADQGFTPQHILQLAFGAMTLFFRSGGQYFCKSNFRPMSQKFRYIYF